MIWFLSLIFLQVLVAAGVVLFLNRKLNIELIEAALEKLFAVNVDAISGKIRLTSAGALSEEVKSRVTSILKRKMPQLEIIFVEDKKIKSGLLIELPSQVIDCSLSNRLKNFWG